MKPKYTAKVYLEDGSIVENVGHHPEQLIAGMPDQAQVQFSQINGEIIDNNTHRIVKNIQYDPLEDI